MSETQELKIKTKAEARAFVEKEGYEPTEIIFSNYDTNEESFPCYFIHLENTTQVLALRGDTGKIDDSNDFYRLYPSKHDYGESPWQEVPMLYAGIDNVVKFLDDLEFTDDL